MLVLILVFEKEEYMRCCGKKWFTKYIWRGENEPNLKYPTASWSHIFNGSLELSDIGIMIKPSIEFNAECFNSIMQTV